MDKLKYVICLDDCFKVESTNEKELIEMAKLHVKIEHHEEITNAEAKKMVKSCD
ncbi:MAG: hypothetical protein WC796_04610 [Candidatus Pacearchaeota archaeon]|jgi:hypothetical protein